MGPYHERQVKELCLLHALNNVFQSSEAFTQADLDAICYRLNPSTWLNPHKSWLGLGNYDVNVLAAALHTRACDLVWWDKRRQPDTIVTERVLGFILNTPSSLRLGWLPLPVQRRHWVALKELQGEEGGFYNLDSKAREAVRIGGRAEFLEFVRGELEGKEKELFLVVSSEVQEDASWRTDSP